MISLLYLVGSFGLSVLLCAVFVRFFKKIGAISNGNSSEIRWASRSKPLAGGIVFFLTFLIYSLVHFSLAGKSSSQAGFLPLFLIACLGFLTGLVDDAYNTRPLLKFLGQLSCGVVLVGSGAGIAVVGIPVVDGLLTLLWVVGIMNSVNMLDNMDGVTGTLAILLIGSVLLVMGITGHGSSEAMWAVSLVLLGTLAGFLLLNWNPSKLYMGDTGSQFLGAVLAYLGVRYFWNLPQADGASSLLRQFALPLLAFSMTIMDTSFVTVARLSRGQSPFVGGRDHITHHLVYLGLKDKYVPLVIGLVTLLSNLIVLASLLWLDSWSTWHSVGSYLYLGVLFMVFASLYRMGKVKQLQLSLSAAKLLEAKPPLVELRPLEKPLQVVRTP